MKNIHGFPTYVLVPDYMGPRKLLIVRTSHFSEILTPDTLFPSKKLIISPMYIGTEPLKLLMKIHPTQVMEVLKFVITKQLKLLLTVHPTKVISLLRFTASQSLLNLTSESCKSGSLPLYQDIWVGLS